MIHPRFHCRYEDKLILDRPDVFKAYLESMAGKGDLELIVRPWKQEKSLQQLRYAHGVIFTLCSEASGYTKEEVKGILKDRFLRVHKEINGKTIEYTRSLADLDKDEMKQFIDDCIILAAKHWSVVVPEPESVSY